MVSNDTHRRRLEGIALGLVILSMYGHCPNLCSIGGWMQSVDEHKIDHDQSVLFALII